MAKTFFIVLRQLVVPAGASERQLPARAAARLGIPEEDIVSWRPVRRSLDARKRRGKAVNVYHLRLELPNRHRRQLAKTPGLDLVFEQGGHHLALDLSDPAPPPGRPRPLVVGAGPAGLFAALRLARSGWNPILIDRGDPPGPRRSIVADFWRRGRLDADSNVLYGIGGAGLFSDGKLNTRHKDRAGLDAILRILVEAGAPERIRLDAAPHVGSDLLGEAVERLCRDILRAGGEIRHRCRLDRLVADAGRLAGAVLVQDGREESIGTNACILAVGHSARDVQDMLFRLGVRLEAKPFAIGLRVEMPQEQVDASQRGGSFAPGPGEAASFRLSRAPEAGAEACYTFCMCPGGLVVACASEPGRLCVNGMSYHARAGEWANAAFLTPVGQDDFAPHARAAGVPPELSGVAFQRYWEEAAYQAGLDGGPYSVPASGLADFVHGGAGALPESRSVGRAVPADLRALLPEKIGDTLAAAIPAMLARLRKVDPARVVLYGVETRTSSPVRMPRDEKSGQSPQLPGLFPAGEGSGHAGGIMTSALDGWHAAERLMRSGVGRMG